MTKPTTTLRKIVLQEVGGIPAGKKRRKKLSTINISPGNKTALMWQLEQQYGKGICQLLVVGSCRKLAKRLGIHYSTISRWRSRIRKEAR